MDALLRHYPDVAEQGGIGESLRKAWIEAGSSIEEFSISEGRHDTNESPKARLLVYVRVVKGERFAYVYLVSNERMFEIVYGKQGIGWKREVLFCGGRSPDLNDVAESIYRWIGEKVSMKDLFTEFDFEFAFGWPNFEISESDFETGNAVEDRWLYYSESENHLIWPHLKEFVEVAKNHPELRRRLPVRRHFALHFERCQKDPRHPYEELAVGSVFDDDTREFLQDQYELRRVFLGQSSREKPIGLGIGNSVGIVALLVHHLEEVQGQEDPGSADSSRTNDAS